MKRITLCYHQVAPAAEAGRGLNIEPARLDSHIRFFRRRFLFVLAKDILKTKGKAVCLTFDDAYVSTLTYGLEVLQRLQSPASVYVVPGLAGKTSAWDQDREKPLADWPLLREAAKASIEIGNHTNSHARLASLGEADERVQWSEAHDRLRREGFEPKSACYPYGLASPRSGALLNELGYECAFAIKPSSEHSDPYLLPRVVVAYGDALPLLIYKVYVRPLLPR